MLARTTRMQIPSGPAAWRGNESARKLHELKTRHAGASTGAFTELGDVIPKVSFQGNGSFP